MNCEEILAQLAAMASPGYKKNIIALGIPEDSCLGVSTPALRSLAKNIKKDQELAYALWNSGVHEAKLLAVLLMDAKKVSMADVENMMAAVYSWDLCDHLCKNLMVHMKSSSRFIIRWHNDSRLYYKRAAFTLIATLMIHEEAIEDEQISMYLHMIVDDSEDDRMHVKKAILWALREIGKRDLDGTEQALQCANTLCEASSVHQNWIGRQAKKELELLVSVAGRRRLIVKTAKMAQS